MAWFLPLFYELQTASTYLAMAAAFAPVKLTAHDVSCIMCEGVPKDDDHAYVPQSQEVLTDAQLACEETLQDNVEELIDESINPFKVPETPKKAPRKRKFARMEFYSENRCRVQVTASESLSCKVAKTYISSKLDSGTFKHTVLLHF